MCEQKEESYLVLQQDPLIGGTILVHDPVAIGARAIGTTAIVEKLPLRTNQAGRAAGPDGADPTGPLPKARGGEPIFT